MASAQPTKDVRRATPQDFPELEKLWWRAQLDSEALEPRTTEFQVVVENGRIIGALGLQSAARQGKIYGEAVDDPARAEELRAILWQRIHTWAKNLGLWRLWTGLGGAFWANQGFQPHDASAQIPPEFSIEPTAFLVLQLGPEPSRAAAAIGEMGMIEVASRAQRTKFLTRTKVVALYLPLAMFLITRLFFWSVIFHKHPKPLPKPPAFKVHTNQPPPKSEPESPNTIKA